MAASTEAADELPRRFTPDLLQAHRHRAGRDLEDAD